MTDTAALQPRPAGRDRLVGIGLMLLALTCFSGLDTGAKWLNQHIHPVQTIWLRFVTSVALVALLLNPLSHPDILETRRPWLQTVRSLFLFLSTLLNFTALNYLQLAETTAIAFAAPLVVALLSGPILGEWVGPRRLVAIAVGFVGVIVITRPGMEGFKPAYLLSLACVLVYAGYNLSTRLLSFSDTSQTTMLWSGLVGTVVMTLVVPFFPGPPPSLTGWAVALGIGALGAVGHYLLILAHARAPAAILAPFIYSQIVTMIALGYFIFGDVPDSFTLGGAGIVIASGLYLLYRERVQKKPSGPSAEV